MEFKVLPTPSPSPLADQIYELKKAMMANKDQWIRVEIGPDEGLTASEIESWRFGRCGELRPEVRPDTGSMTSRWIDVRLTGLTRPSDPVDPEEIAATKRQLESWAALEES